MDDARWNPERRGRPWTVIDTTRGKGGRDSEGREETVSMVETALSREGSALPGTAHALSSTRSEGILVGAKRGFLGIGGSIESKRYR
jgi:hypothetical protein